VNPSSNSNSNSNTNQSNAGAAAGGGQLLKVLVADDHYLVREGLKLALRQIDSGVELLEAETVSQAVEVYQAHPDIDLVLLDLTMPGTQGSATAFDGFEKACPDARVVVVSAVYDMRTVQWALRKGALGFIPKLAGKEVLLSALRFILDGGIYVPPEALAGSAAEPAPPRTRTTQAWLDDGKPGSR